MAEQLLNQVGEAHGITMVGSRIYAESQSVQMILPLREETKQQSEKENSRTDDTTGGIEREGGECPPTSPRSRDGSEILPAHGWGPREYDWRLAELSYCPGRLAERAPHPRWISAAPARPPAHKRCVCHNL